MQVPRGKSVNDKARHGWYYKAIRYGRNYYDVKQVINKADWLELWHVVRGPVWSVGFGGRSTPWRADKTDTRVWSLFCHGQGFLNRRVI